MICACRGLNVRYSAGGSDPTRSFATAGNLRWVRISSHAAAAIPVPASTAAVARSFATRECRRVCTEDRWKRFLLLLARCPPIE